MIADWVTALATAGAAGLAAWAAFSAGRAAKAAEASAHASVDLVRLERERFAIEEAERNPAELSIDWVATKMFRHIDLVATNAGPAAALDVVVEWLDPESLQPAEVKPSPKLTASRLAPHERLIAHALAGNETTFGVRLAWRDSRGPQSREDTIHVVYRAGA